MAYFPFDSPVVTECIGRPEDSTPASSEQPIRAKVTVPELREFQGQNAVAGHSAAFVDGANCHAPCDTEEPTKHDIASCSPPMKTRMYITPEGGLHARIDSLFCFIIGTVGQYSSVMLIPGKDKSPIRTSEK
ncbi:hypothetical protein CIHG_05162 [Coccidioides immitis H538.4]|uniref:Uncharacterized protein n=2 Tax=Coccidioides immitis TaxID=5501 RepID=A0A0J8RQK4_COCIT|nr:hypothetical protein CIRG_08235 [Coccidioides immitis RMSCC 2394]KMU87370.1 hypothetical protein CIHG_05162 [Coccidioides immitis H538.4]